MNFYKLRRGLYLSRIVIKVSFKFSYSMMVGKKLIFIVLRSLENKVLSQETKLDFLNYVPPSVNTLSKVLIIMLKAEESC